MYNANYVDRQIEIIKKSGIPMSEQAWQAAQLCIGWPYIFGDRGQYCTPGQRKTVYNAHTDQEGLVSKCKALSLQDGKAVITGNCGGCKWYPGGERVRSFDCRGFTYWILLQIYGWKLMGTGCTGQWNDARNWKAQGEISDGIPQGVIVCVFYFKKDKSGKRTKTVQHTGLYYNGETIECANGVQYSKTLNKKWDVWGVPACVGGDIPTPTPPDPGDRPTLRKGDSGTYVTMLQGLLMQRGYDLPKYGADGKFGNETLEAVKAFQKANGITANGIVGTETWAALEGTEPTKRYTVTVPHLTIGQAEALITQYPGATKTEEPGENGLT